jgi:hypothetical protein
VKGLAGLAGFEPTITESKSVALPLCYSPIKSPWKGKSIIGNCFVDFSVSIVAAAASVVGLVVPAATVVGLVVVVVVVVVVAVVAVVVH